MNTKVEDLLAKIEDLLDEGSHSIMGGGKVKVDPDAVRALIADIRVNYDDEVIQARRIAAERKVILTKASDAADLKIQQAEIKARKLVEENEIVKKAEVRAQEIVNDANRQGTEIVDHAKEEAVRLTQEAQQWAARIKKSASTFVDTIMEESDQILAKSIDDFTKSLNKVRIASQHLKSATSNPEPEE